MLLPTRTLNLLLQLLPAGFRGSVRKKLLDAVTHILYIYIYLTRSPGTRRERTLTD